MIPAGQARQLDNPVWYSLTGRHRRFAVGSSSALRYPADMSPFFALPDAMTPESWNAAAELLDDQPPGLFHQDVEIPAGWTIDSTLDVVQMITENPIGVIDARATLLTGDDLPPMLRLADEAKPGPFGPRTPLLGDFHGIFLDGVLAAMAGERFHVDGWTEISAVATSPRHRGQGLASALIRHVAATIETRHERAFLHVVESNPALGLYEHIGFTQRRTAPVRRLAPPRTS
ncbi:GNAT family N-acetyltransferase [Frondihabitans cladoniiphilus]|uniref:GNAT family N-acetyltransferase n=1 Tax=Frondihabitans cladoniiphilus TaxID=715785 RepID=A0ABP8VKC9_9MICO